jgi:pyruvate,water dikinase
MNKMTFEYPDMSPAACGNKAANLARLQQYGFTIPPFFVIDGGALADGSEVLNDAIAAAVSRIGAESFAVRSSSRDEDGDSHSFAGQFDTFLNVAPGDVPGRARQVARSGDSAHLQTYCNVAGKPISDSVPAVIVQTMIDATSAGVAFAADPVSGDADMAVIAATRGTGDALVGGEVQGDTWRVTVDERIVETDIAGKTPVLREAEVLAVARLVRAVTARCGHAQDIEWAFDGDTLYLLQSRAITTAVRVQDEGEYALWDNSNIVESYGGITLPLTFSVAREAYQEAYRHMGRALGVSETAIRDNARAYEQMIGLVSGRVYYNLLNWYRLLMLTPGFRFNATFMEQMMGVTEGLPRDVVPKAPERGRFGAVHAGLDMLRVGVKLMSRLVSHRRHVARFHQRLEEILAVVPLHEMTLNELADYYERLQASVIPAWDTPLINDLYCMIFHGALRRASERWLDETLSGQHNDLVAGEAAIISLEPVRRMQRMAQLARARPSIVSALCNADAGGVAVAIASLPELDEAMREYVARFGDRCLDELKLESATLGDDPLPLYRAVGHLARQPARRDVPDNARGDAEQAVFDALRRQPVRRGIYRTLLNLARARIRDRENLRFERTRVYGRVRGIFLEIGHRLASLGAISEANDVFYLEAAEILSFVRGTGPGTRLSVIVDARRDDYQRFAANGDLPRRFVTCGPPQLDASIRIVAGNTDVSAGDRTGQACSTGIVRGPVRIVRDPRDCDFREGDILVAERTDPGWVTIFPLVRGMIMERGSLLSHSAIVAREMNIPAVVGVEDACRWLKDGDWVELDGGSGLIRKLEEAEVAA